MSSKSVKSSFRSDLWRTLALLRGEELCLADWKRRLGTGFESVSAYLVELPGTIADTFPDPESDLPLIPRRIHDGTFTARPDDPEVTSVPAVSGITAAQIARWHLSWEKIDGAVVGALGIEWHSGPGPFETPWVRGVGVFRGVDATWSALLLLARSSEEALGWVRLLLRGESRFLILPFHDELCADMATAHGHRYAALDRDVRFVKAGRRWELKGAAIGASPKKKAIVGWTQAELQKVKIIGRYNSICFADGFVIDLRRRPKCRAFLDFLLKRCLLLNDFSFSYETIRQDYKDANPARPIKSDHLDYELFKNVEGFGRLFETIDQAKQDFRLLIRPR